jgi:hypothetical protein
MLYANNLKIGFLDVFCPLYTASVTKVGQLKDSVPTLKEEGRGLVDFQCNSKISACGFYLFPDLDILHSSYHHHCYLKCSAEDCILI